MKALLTSALLLFGCSKAVEKPEPVDPREAEAALFDEAVNRLEAMSDGGWVVSRNAENGPEHTGDSLIWTGMAMGDLDCTRGVAQQEALVTMVRETGGKMYRHPSLKDQVSMDGAIGLYYGIARREHRCGAYWAAVLEATPEFWENPLHVDGTEMPAEFTYVRDLLGFKLGFLPEPAVSRKGALEAEIAAWTLAVAATKAACYRVHLSLLGLQTIESLGGTISGNGRNAFCSLTKAMDLPTVDHWCGRPTAFLAQFQYNAWEMRHQRCGAWETPDGGGLATPALDLITYLRSAFTI